MHRRTVHQKLTLWNSSLLLLFGFFTILIAFIASQIWKEIFNEWLRLFPYFIWSIVPYAILWWLNAKQHRSRQAIIILCFIIIIGIFGIVFYLYALIAGLKPQTNVIFLLIPFYQFIASVIAIPSIVFFKKKV